MGKKSKKQAAIAVQKPKTTIITDVDMKMHKGKYEQTFPELVQSKAQPGLIKVKDQIFAGEIGETL